VRGWEARLLKLLRSGPPPPERAGDARLGKSEALRAVQDGRRMLSGTARQLGWRAKGSCGSQRRPRVKGTHRGEETRVQKR
jgi:hypothetical protein